jgi:hypothetical protein
VRAHALRGFTSHRYRHLPGKTLVPSGTGDRCLCGWLHLSVHGGGLADVPSDPHRAIRALLTPGVATVVALNKTTQVVGFAHAFANGVTTLPHRRYAGFPL